MIVSDIKQDIKSVLNFCDDTTVYNRLTYAIEILANKGSWDSMVAYLDIGVDDQVVTLPREVESPIKININGNPSFSRNKLYEFTLSGPGSDMKDTAGFSWMDKGTVPVIAQPSSPRTLGATSSSGVTDNGKKIRVYGLNEEGESVEDTLTLSSVTPPQTTNKYKRIDRVSKDITIGSITLRDYALLVTYSVYLPTETEPEYRQIRLTKKAENIRMLFRRKTHIISSDEDFIPLHSQMAVLMMIMALESYRKGTDFAKGQAYEAQALAFLKEEQESRNNFDMAETSEKQPALDLNYNNADSIIVADVYDDAAGLFGSMGRQAVFDKISDAIELLSNKGHWDGLIGYVDIMTDNDNYVTLPRYVASVMALNIGGEPKIMRNKWYEFHINGLGSCGASCGHWDTLGSVVALKPLSCGSQFMAVPDSSSDEGKVIKVYGYDTDGRKITQEVFPTYTETPPVESDPVFSRIERITREASEGYVSLLAYEPDSGNTELMGYYQPDETEPNYIRLKLPYKCAWVRMRYRKRSLRITSLTEPIHLANKLALMSALRAVKAFSNDDIMAANAWEAKSEQLMEDEQSSSNPAETWDFQFDMSHNTRVII